MIAANELRIGNYVLAKPIFGNDKKFKPLQIASPNEIFRCYNTPKDFNPIPITPEILEKCGFENISEETNLYVEFADNKHSIYTTKDGYLFHPFYTQDKDCQIEIKYLHQLQNLYFSLTGEELTVNL